MKALRKKKLPRPSLERLCKIYTVLSDLHDDDVISSKELGSKIGAAPHNIRKDISYLKGEGTAGSGYDVGNLKNGISDFLGFDQNRNACVVGLGDLGQAILNNEKLIDYSFHIAAGFDASINRLETIKTEVPVFPSYEIENVIQRLDIDLAVLTVPAGAAGKTAEQLVKAGIKGIINFSPAVLSGRIGGAYVSNIDIIGAFRFLSALCTLDEGERM